MLQGKPTEVFSVDWDGGGLPDKLKLDAGKFEHKELYGDFDSNVPGLNKRVVFEMG